MDLDETSGQVQGPAVDFTLADCTGRAVRITGLQQKTDFFMT